MINCTIPTEPLSSQVEWRNIKKSLNIFVNGDMQESPFKFGPSRSIYYLVSNFKSDLILWN